MQTPTAKRVGIVIRAPLERRLTEALRCAGVTGFTVLPVLGGAGRSVGIVAVICLLWPDRLDALFEAAFAVAETHIGPVSVTECQVLWAERF